MDDHNYLKAYLAEDEAGEEKEDGAASQSEESGNLDLDEGSKAQVEAKATGKKKAASGGVPHVKLPDLTKIPHPKGSIGLVLLMILILLFAVVPSPNGKNRLRLLADALMGRVKVAGSGSSTGNTSSSGDKTAASAHTDSNTGDSYSSAAVYSSMTGAIR